MFLKINFVLLWLLFVFLISYVKEINNIAFFYISSIMLYSTYYFNSFKNIYMSLQVGLLLLMIPSFIFWYVFITYNYFLKIKPISYEIVVFIMFFYFYILIYLFYNHGNTPNKTTIACNQHL